MSRIVVVAGSKGGSGKTLVSHAVGHGLALHGVKVFHISTDPGRPVLSAEARRYATLDGRDPRQLGQFVDKLAAMDDAVCIIDGGGSRPQVDAVLARYADATLIPFMSSRQDLAVVRADLDRLPQAIGLPNRWPTQAWAQQVADREMTTELAAYLTRIMSRVPDVNALSTLLREEGPSPKIAASCKSLAVRVLDRMGANLHSFTIQERESVMA